jgi:hypothetical protein
MLGHGLASLRAADGGGVAVTGRHSTAADSGVAPSTSIPNATTSVPATERASDRPAL